MGHEDDTGSFFVQVRIARDKKERENGCQEDWNEREEGKEKQKQRKNGQNDAFQGNLKYPGIGNDPAKNYGSRDINRS